MSEEAQLRPNGATALAPFADTPQEALENIFGFTSFRDGQHEVIDSLVAGDDALVVMPTGAGKSLCYQLSGVLMQGVVIVVSPLISLMKDQVDMLAETGLPATEINSSMSRGEQQNRIDRMYRGDYKIVYVAPERFRSKRFREALSDIQIGLFAIDEAHCISQWGHDFRPDYRRLAEVREEFGNPQTVALTATATEFVQEDILSELEMPEARQLVSGFERPNLYFEVFQAQGKEDKLRRTKGLVNYHEGESVIVFGATRKQVRKVHGALTDADIDAGLYHGGLSDTERSDIQEDWMSGETPVIVTTNAFGMGVDKPDVRAVIHYNMPGSIEAYYQEAGRAGRDGEKAHCLLLFNYADTGIHEWFAENSFPLSMEIVRVWVYLSGLGEGTYELTPGEISKKTKMKGKTIHPMAVESALTLLARAGHIRKSRNQIEVLEDVDANDLNIDFDRLEERRHIRKEKISDVVSYANTSACFQASLLEHFASRPSFGDQCGFCSACDPPPAYVEEMAGEFGKTMTCSEPPKTVLKKTLAGIARGEGRRGVSAIAGMLTGSTAKAVRKAGFTKLSTHGVLSELRRKDASYLVNLCARFGLARRNDHGCVLLTTLGADVMKGKESAPDSLQRLLENSMQSGPPTSSSSGTTGGKKSVKRTHLETHRLHLEGLDVEEIAQERGLTPRTVSDHLIRLGAGGKELKIETDADKLDVLQKKASNWQEGDSLKALRERLPGEWSYRNLKAHLAALLLRRNG
jgi:ATP-dependent DNA helicase RecQ